jgi:hypothetical protein
MSWLCEYPEHEGDRLVVNRFDRFSKRTTYVRVDGRQRLREHSMPGGHMCKACVEKDFAKIKPAFATGQESFL